MKQERMDKDGKDSSDSADMLDKFAKAKDPVTGAPVTSQQIVAMSLAVLAAGSDTTSTAMRALLMFLLTTDGLYEKVQAEVSVLLLSFKSKYRT
jgi:cytochrome P450